MLGAPYSNFCITCKNLLTAHFTQVSYGRTVFKLKTTKTKFAQRHLPDVFKNIEIDQLKHLKYNKIIEGYFKTSNLGSRNLSHTTYYLFRFLLGLLRPLAFYLYKPNISCIRKQRKRRERERESESETEREGVKIIIHNFYKNQVAVMGVEQEVRKAYIRKGRRQGCR